MRDDMDLPFGDEDLEKFPYLQPGNYPDEVEYLLHQREKLGGFLPERRDH